MIRITHVFDFCPKSFSRNVLKFDILLTEIVLAITPQGFFLDILDVLSINEENWKSKYLQNYDKRLDMGKHLDNSKYILRYIQRSQNLDEIMI